MQQETGLTVDLPLMPLRDVVVFPHMAATLLVGRETSINALNTAMEDGKKILLLAQKDPKDDEPSTDQLYQTGTVATILRLFKLPEGPVKLLVEGERRARVLSIEAQDGNYASAHIEYLDEATPSSEEQAVLMNNLWECFDAYLEISKKEVSSETLESLRSVDELSRLLDMMIAQSSIELVRKQQALELQDVVERLEFFIDMMDAERDLHSLDKRIRNRVKKQMEKSQREYYLNEQMKAIQKELGDLDEDAPDELSELKEKIKSIGMPDDVLEKALSEWRKLSLMSPMSSEAAVLRNYLDWMIKVPWNRSSKARIDLLKARDILDKDHYGLEEVKERILEYLAVQKRVKKARGSILCLVGPPGVGKTSLGKSVAKATGRKFIRMALGGVRDEAEIRGHRRTYIGALPGKITQKMAKVEVNNPLFLLDEIDKMGMDNRGDPASALLEVLDPEQNNEFNDHYLEVDYDLSNVMFISTSNSMNIPGPLLDRMEVIRLPGYTEEEKLQIAKRHLLSKQIKANGLKSTEVDITDDAIRDVIRYYTREAGVRNLEREIAKLCRKVVFELSSVSVSKAKKTKSKTARKAAIVQTVIDAGQLIDYLGPHRYQIGVAEKKNQVGLVTGLAWTNVGGELLNIESALVPGKGRYTSTGSLGDVMQESIKAAMTAVKARGQELGLAADTFEKHDLHIHMPEGATPKDGPSAGIGIATVIVSSLSGIPVKKSVAMTGEINLRGHVMKIGGLKEKLLAAHRGGIKTVIIPQDNVSDLQKIPDEILDAIKVQPVSSIDEVLSTALEKMPSALSDEEYALSVKGLFSVTSQGTDRSGNVKTH
ncbi:MAG: endopeptidase La [Chloroflexota bacterium]